MITIDQKSEILLKAKIWFKESVSDPHLINTEKLINPSEFKINPFTIVYLANFLTGNSDKKSLAKALLYPRVLGTSIVTTFGNGIQKFVSSVLDGYASTTSGIDIEFIDQLDNRKKYCQLKSGPETINKGDVKSIGNDFNSVKNLARTNNLQLAYGDLVVGVVYGKPNQLIGHYRAITEDYDAPVYVGQEFWHRLTGDPDFYVDLITAIGEVAIEADYSAELNTVIDRLAENINLEAILTDQ
jgi:hypothetical protein